MASNSPINTNTTLVAIFVDVELPVSASVPEAEFAGFAPDNRPFSLAVSLLVSLPALAGPNRITFSPRT